MSRSAILTVVVILAVSALVWFGMQGTSDVQCRVCLTWNGEQRCQESAGATEEEAIDRARTAICQILASGRADNIKCGDQQPDSVECR
jgi:hypothetical protein